jgi:hypothetical protein
MLIMIWRAAFEFQAWLKPGIPTFFDDLAEGPFGQQHGYPPKFR